MQAGEGAGAGVEIGRHRHRHLVLAQQLNRRFTGFIKEVERAGEQGCHGAAFAHRRHALFRQILDMVGGKPMITAHQLRAAQRRELLNVAFYRNAQRLRRLKDALSLLRAEADVFAEDVNAFKQSLLPQRRQNGLADQRNIAVSIALIFRRRGVGGEQRRRQFHAIMIGQLSGDPQHFAFVWQVEAVAGFDLQGGHPFTQQAFQTRLGQRQ